MLMLVASVIDSRFIRTIRQAIVSLFFLGWTIPVLGAGLCSPDVGKVTLNEYNYQLNFSEVKRLNVATSLTGWKVRVYSGAGTFSQQDFPTAEQCGEYYILSGFSSVPKDADIVLLDGNNDVVDILRVRQLFPVAAYYSPVPSCAFVSPPTDLQIDPAQKGVDRSPDSVGPWRNTPGTGANSYQTRCGGNTPGGAPADVRVTKTASSSSILLGANVTFTVTVSNLGPNVASTLIINDALPAGLSYVSHTATAGTYSAVSGLWTLSALAVNGSQTLSITASGASGGTWTNTATVSADNTDPNPANNTASAVVTVASSAPGSFNAFETGTAAGATIGFIKTRIAGNAFNLDVVAISGGAQASTFNNTVKVELLGNTTTGVSLDGNNCPTSSSLLQTVSPTPAIGGGRSTVGFAAVSNAWKDVRVRISYPAVSPTVISCSTNNFAIRPATLGSMTVSDTDSVTAGTVRTLDNTAANGGNVHKADRPFRVAATALNNVGATTTNYNGSPAATLTACLLPGTACTLGALNVGTWTAASGVVVSTTATYSEVGAFSMKWVDTSFADVDLADSSTVERYVESAVFNVGRFVPDHFVLTTASTPQFKTFNDTACPTRSFTYIGQPFGYLTLPQATITAKNATGGTTINYAGALWKLAAAGATQVYTAVTGTLDTGLVGTPTVTASGGGVGTLTANAADVVAFTRTTPVAPFNASISLSMNIVDSAENAVSGNGLINTATPALFSSVAFDSGNNIRFGQLVLTNAHGSELLDLPVPLETRFWTGSGFSRNTADACTQLAATNIALSNWRRDLNACETSVTLSGRFNAGRGNLKLSKPGEGNTGSVDLTLLLGATGAGSTCVGVPGVVSAAGAASQSWLQGRWSGAAYDQNPAARGSFGLHRGSKPLIYFREMY
ncbi:MAG: DUF11 domain-containing protein [Thiobacillus sp.]|nr:DUF11 domain-containing protein [Thiobacillus sp.]